MATSKEKAMSDIARASGDVEPMNHENLLQLLEIDITNESVENLVEKLFNVSTHPNVVSLPDNHRLSAIRTAQEIIGSLLKGAIIYLKTDD